MCSFGFHASPNLLVSPALSGDWEGLSKSKEWIDFENRVHELQKTNVRELLERKPVRRERESEVGDQFQGRTEVEEEGNELKGRESEGREEMSGGKSHSSREEEGRDGGESERGNVSERGSASPPEESTDGDGDGSGRGSADSRKSEGQEEEEIGSQVKAFFLNIYQLLILHWR